MISQAARFLGSIGGAAILGVLLFACSSQGSRSYEKPAAGTTPVVTQRPQDRGRRLSIGEQAAVVAVRQLGVPYRYGGDGRNGFDCSGLVHYAYLQAGKAIPRTTSAQWRKLQPVAAGKLQVGDVLFFNIGGKVTHVGLYLGSRRFVHAPSSGREVTIEELDSAYYRTAFVRGGRP
jgi:cell wall-associated NlpC family hydrolase